MQIKYDRFMNIVYEKQGLPSQEFDSLEIDGRCYDKSEVLYMGDTVMYYGYPEAGTMVVFKKIKKCSVRVSMSEEEPKLDEFDQHQEPTYLVTKRGIYYYNPTATKKNEKLKLLPLLHGNTIKRFFKKQWHRKGYEDLVEFHELVLDSQLWEIANCTGHDYTFDQNGEYLLFPTQPSFSKWEAYHKRLGIALENLRALGFKIQDHRFVQVTLCNKKHNQKTPMLVISTDSFEETCENNPNPIIIFNPREPHGPNQYGRIYGKYSFDGIRTNSEKTEFVRSMFKQLIEEHAIAYFLNFNISTVTGAHTNIPLAFEIDKDNIPKARFMLWDLMRNRPSMYGYFPYITDFSFNTPRTIATEEDFAIFKDGPFKGRDHNGCVPALAHIVAYGITNFMEGDFETIHAIQEILTANFKKAIDNEAYLKEILWNAASKVEKLTNRSGIAPIALPALYGLEEKECKEEVLRTPSESTEVAFHCVKKDSAPRKPATGSSSELKLSPLPANSTLSNPSSQAAVPELTQREKIMISLYNEFMKNELFCPPASEGTIQASTYAEPKLFTPVIDMLTLRSAQLSPDNIPIEEFGVLIWDLASEQFTFLKPAEQEKIIRYLEKKSQALDLEQQEIDALKHFIDTTKSRILEKLKAELLRPDEFQIHFFQRMHHIYCNLWENLRQYEYVSESLNTINKEVEEWVNVEMDSLSSIESNLTSIVGVSSFLALAKRHHQKQLKKELPADELKQEPLPQSKEKSPTETVTPAKISPEARSQLAKIHTKITAIKYFFDELVISETVFTAPISAEITQQYLESIDNCENEIAALNINQTALTELRKDIDDLRYLVTYKNIRAVRLHVRKILESYPGDMKFTPAFYVAYLCGLLLEKTPAGNSLIDINKNTTHVLNRTLDLIFGNKSKGIKGLRTVKQMLVMYAFNGSVDKQLKSEDGSQLILCWTHIQDYLKTNGISKDIIQNHPRENICTLTDTAYQLSKLPSSVWREIVQHSDQQPVLEEILRQTSGTSCQNQACPEKLINDVASSLQLTMPTAQGHQESKDVQVWAKIAQSILDHAPKDNDQDINALIDFFIITLMSQLKTHQFSEQDRQVITKIVRQYSGKDALDKYLPLPFALGASHLCLNVIYHLVLLTTTLKPAPITAAFAEGLVRLMSRKDAENLLKKAENKDKYVLRASNDRANLLILDVMNKQGKIIHLYIEVEEDKKNKIKLSLPSAQSLGLTFVDHYEVNTFPGNRLIEVVEKLLKSKNLSGRTPIIADLTLAKLTNAEFHAVKEEKFENESNALNYSSDKDDPLEEKQSNQNGEYDPDDWDPLDEGTTPSKLHHLREAINELTSIFAAAPDTHKAEEKSSLSCSEEKEIRTAFHPEPPKEACDMDLEVLNTHSEKRKAQQEILKEELPQAVSQQTIEKTKQLLTHVARGEQNEAEGMLKANPSLALARGELTDLSGRVFVNITAFQYAVWALDFHMWKMLQQYLPPEEAHKQLETFDEKPHGSHFEMKHLLWALKTYNADSDYPNGEKGHSLTQKWYQVGKAQRDLPVHVVNHYCTRGSFSEGNTFESEEKLERTMLIQTGDKKMDWFKATYKGNDNVLGDGFAVLARKSCPEAYGCLNGRPVRKECELNAEVLEKLCTAREKQRRLLKTELHNTVTTRPSSPSVEDKDAAPLSSKVQKQAVSQPPSSSVPIKISGSSASPAGLYHVAQQATPAQPSTTMAQTATKPSHLIEEVNRFGSVLSAPRTPEAKKEPKSVHDGSPMTLQSLLPE